MVSSNGKHVKSTHNLLFKTHATTLSNQEWVGLDHPPCCRDEGKMALPSPSIFTPMKHVKVRCVSASQELFIIGAIIAVVILLF